MKVIDLFKALEDYDDRDVEICDTDGDRQIIKGVFIPLDVTEPIVIHTESE